MSKNKKNNEIAKRDAAVMPKADDYANAVTGLGGPPDKSQFSWFQRQPRLHPEELHVWYEQDALASRLIDRLPDDATREGFELTGEDESFNWNAVQSDLEDLDALNAIADGWRWARLMGGSLIVLAVNDGRKFDEPMDMSKVRSLEGIQVIESTWVQPEGFEAGLGSRSFRLPTHYNVHINHAAGRVRKIHRSRVIRLDGMKVSAAHQIAGGGWGPSILQRVATQLRQLGEVMGYSRSIAHNISVPVMKFAGFRTALKGDAKSQREVSQMMETIRMVMDNLHILALDKQDEIGEAKRDVSGLEKLIEKFVDGLVRATDMPRTILLGEQPGGLGASADSEIRAWYDHVHAKQRQVLTPVMNRILEVMLAIRRNRGEKVPTEWQVVWNQLWQPTEHEMAQTNLANAQARQIYFSIGGMSTDEIRTKLESEGQIEDADEPVPPPPVQVNTGSPPGGSGALVTASADEEIAAPSKAPMPDDLVSVREAASQFGVPTRTLSLKCQKGELTYWQFGSRTQVSVAEVAELGRRRDRNGSKKNTLTQPFPEAAAEALGKKYQDLNAIALRLIKQHLIPAIASGNEARITNAIARVQTGVDRQFTDADIASDAEETVDDVSESHAAEFFAALALLLAIGIKGNDRPGKGASGEEEGASAESLVAIELRRKEEEDDSDIEVGIEANAATAAAEDDFVAGNVEFMGKLRGGIAAGLAVGIARELARKEPEEAAAVLSSEWTASGVQSSVGELTVHVPSHAELIADDQVGTLNMNLNRARAEAAGVGSFKWITQGDADVRPSHEEIDGQTFTFASGAPTLGGALPGEQINCRCFPDTIVGLDDLNASENFVVLK